MNYLTKMTFENAIFDNVEIDQMQTQLQAKSILCIKEINNNFYVYCIFYNIKEHCKSFTGVQYTGCVY